MKKSNRICLITPPSPFLLDERVFMHIGILKIAAVLEAKGYHIDFLDLAGVYNYLEVVDSYCSNTDNTLFGITATTPQVPFAVNVSESIKSILPDAKIILGGTHVSLMHSAFKKEKTKGIVERATKDIERLLGHFDILVAGDGELAIEKALGMDRGVIDADDRKSDMFLTNDMFSNNPFPARHLVDIDSYNYSIEGENATSLIAQLGCPFKCTFCGGRNSPFLRNIRTRTTESVVDEIEHLYLIYGFKGFMFYDDELNVNKQWEGLLRAIIKLQKKYDVKFMLRGFVKAEIFTEEQAELMYKAGFRWLLTGFESGDERILKNIEKIAKVEDNTRCVSIAKKYGLKVKALMSIGHAGESKETIDNTKNWLLEVEPDDFDCTIITVYPGSPYFDDALPLPDESGYVYTQPKSGDKLYQSSLNYLEDLDYYKGDPSTGYISNVWTDHLSPSELVEERNSLEEEVRNILNIPFNPTGSNIKFEHSMGQGNIPSSILRKTHNQ